MMFMPIDWPETCYIQEAVYWLALGRVPAFHYYEMNDGRFDAEREAAEGTISYDLGFSEAEFEWVGVKIDYEKYINAPSWIASGAEHIAEWESRRPSFSVNENESQFEQNRWDQEVMSAVRLDAELGDWRRQIEMAFIPIIDKARAEVFLALSSGQLKSIGWQEYQQNEDGTADGHFVDIAPDKWSLRTFDWEASNLILGNENFRSVQVYTKDLLKKFPHPACEPVTLTINAYLGVAVVIGGNGKDQLQQHNLRPRGRPQKADGAVKMVVQNVFRERFKREGIPDKTEAILQEIIDYVGMAFGEKISRSTAQNYLAPLKDGLI